MRPRKEIAPTFRAPNSSPLKDRRTNTPESKDSRRPALEADRSRAGAAVAGQPSIPVPRHIGIHSHPGHRSSANSPPPHPAGPRVRTRTVPARDLCWEHRQAAASVLLVPRMLAKQVPDWPLPGPEPVHSRWRKWQPGCYGSQLRRARFLWLERAAGRTVSTGSYQISQRLDAPER
jgi:hypothetical protein